MTLVATKKTAPQRLFAVVTPAEWDAATKKSSHLDICQALEHLQAGEDDCVRLRCAPSRLAYKQKIALDYARKLRIFIATHADASGWLYVKRVPTRSTRGRRRA